MDYSIFERATGAITGTISIPADLAHVYDTDTHGIVKGKFQNDNHLPTHYINPITGNPNIRCGLRSARQCETLVLTSVEPVTVLEGLPENVRFVFKPNGPMQFYEQAVHVSHSLPFAFTEPGTYTIEAFGKYRGGPWYVEAISLDSLIDRRTAEIDAAKQAVIDAGLLWNGHKWDADAASIASLRSYLGSVPPGFYFTDYDNVNVTLNAEQVEQLAQAMSAFTFAVHAKAQQLKQFVRSGLTIHEVLGIDLKKGWPA